VKRAASLLVLPSRLFVVSMLLLAVAKQFSPDGLLRPGLRWLAVSLIVWGLAYPFARTYHWFGRS
jgi:hypothetical protein